MNTKTYIRGYDEYKLLRNVNDPIFFLGVPFKISIIALVSIVFSVMIGFILNAIGVPGIIAGAVCIILLASCTVGVREFYKKYGVNGYELKRRDKILTNEILADKPLSEILKNL